MNNELHHVNDWLPTLMSAAKSASLGCDGCAAHNLWGQLGKEEPPWMLGDGIDNWKMLSVGGATPSARTEMIHVTQVREHIGLPLCSFPCHDTVL